LGVGTVTAFNALLKIDMTSNLSASARENKIIIWISASLFWGSVFYVTSIYALGFVSEQQNGVSMFHPSFYDGSKAYSIYAVFILAVAISGFLFSRYFYDPTGEKRNKRIDDITAGKKENYLVSFVGSLATGFVFGVMTALAFMIAHQLFGVAAAFDFTTVMLASLLNVGAGLAGSIFTGVVFLVLKLTGKFPTSESTS
jgi:MFS family permease